MKSSQSTSLVYSTLVVLLSSECKSSGQILSRGEASFPQLHLYLFKKLAFDAILYTKANHESRQHANIRR